MYYGYIFKCQFLGTYECYNFNSTGAIFSDVILGYLYLRMNNLFSINLWTFIIT